MCHRVSYEIGGLAGKKNQPDRPRIKAKRKRYGSEFKARVVLEAPKEERTLQEIAKEYEVHPVQVCE